MGAQRQDQTTSRHLRLPLFQGLLPVKGAQLPTDILAGLTLAALAIPEVMGYTKIAGTPVITGLYTILIPMTLFALFGSSRHLVVGADSATAALLAAGLAGMATAGSAEWLALAGLLALLSAGFLILARLIRLGFLADFLSRTVLTGFLTGVGIQVALGQIAEMLGLASRGHGPLHQIMGDLAQIGQTHVSTLAVSLGVLVIIAGSKRLSQHIPGALIAVVGALVVSWALNLHSHGVAVLGAVPSGLPKLGLPPVDWSWSLVQQLLPTAFAMFVVILAQSAATSRAYATRYHERFSENIDLVGLGLANVGAALSGTFTVNGSPTKTQMVDSAGGQTQLAQLTTSLIVLLVLLFLTGPLAYMPNAVLAAVVFLIGVELIDVTGMRQIWAHRPSEFWVALITAVVVVVVGVEQGILLAMILSLIDHTRRGYHPKNAVLIPDATLGMRALPVSEAQQALPGLLVYRFTHSLYYANAQAFSEQVAALAEGAQPPLRWFCLDAAAVDDVDFSAAATLRETHSALHERGIRLVFAEVSDDVCAALERSGLTALVGQDAFYRSLGDVARAYRHTEQGGG